MSTAAGPSSATRTSMFIGGSWSAAASGQTFTAEQLVTLKAEGVALDREMASLRLWADRPEDLVPYDLRLSTILWQGS